jgi:hypothetical protein
VAGSRRKHVLISGDDHETIRDIAIARNLSDPTASAKARPRISEALADLLEIAFRCIESHGADYAAPFQVREALDRARASAEQLRSKGQKKAKRSATRRKRSTRRPGRVVRLG